MSGARCSDGPIRAEDADEDDDDEDDDEDDDDEEEEEEEEDDDVLEEGKARGSGSGGVSCVKSAGAWR